jgi:hypothetical protein
MKINNTYILARLMLQVRTSTAQNPYGQADGSHQMNEKVTFLSQEKATAIAEEMGWSILFAEGFIEGQFERWRGNRPSNYVTVGADEYARGFRAGFFVRSSAERERPHPSTRHIEDIAQVK